MTIRKTLVLALLLGAVVLYVFKFELPREEARAGTGKPFAGLAAAALTEVKIVGAGGEVLLRNSAVQAPADGAASAHELSAEELKAWRLGDVPDAVLERGAVNSLLIALGELDLGPALPAGELDGDRSVYGLTEPELRITVTGPAGAREVLFGKRNEYVSKRYAMLAGEEAIHLASEALFTAAKKNKDDFRSRTPVEFTDGEVSALVLRGAVPIRLVQGADSRWQIAEPGPYPASDAAVADLTRELRNLRAVEFKDDPGELSQYGLAAPEHEISIEFKDGTKEPLTLSLGTPPGDSEDTWLRISGRKSLFRLASNPADRLLKPVEALRERRLFRFATDRVTTVTLEPGGEAKVELVKQDGKWTVNGRPGDEPFILDLLRNLSELEAVSFLPPGRSLGAPAAVIRVTTAPLLKEGSPEVRTLTIGQPIEDVGGVAGQSAQVEGGGDPFVLGAEYVKALLPRAEALQASTPPALPTPTPPVDMTLVTPPAG